MKLVKTDNPFNPAMDREIIEITKPAALVPILRDHGVDVDHSVISVDGEILPPERLSSIIPAHDAYIVVVPRLENSTLRMVAQIGVMAASSFLPGALGVTSALGKALFSAGISIGGNLMIAGIASLFSKHDAGSSYTTSGPITTSRSGIPIPRGAGKIRVAGNIVMSWVDLEKADADLHDADDGAKDVGRQWINVLICFGVGPARSLSDIRINDKDIANYSDVAYFVRLGTNDQEPVTSTDSAWVVLNRTTDGDLPNNNPTRDFNRITNCWRQSQRIRAGQARNYVIVEGHRNDTQRLDVTVQMPNGCWRYDDNKIIKRLDITYNVYYKLHSATTWTLAKAHVYTNIRQTMLRQITTIDGLAPGCYDVKVEKIGSAAHGSTPQQKEWESDYFGDELWIESVQETSYDSLAYPNMILLGLRIMATSQLSGSDLQVSALVDYDLRNQMPTELATYAYNNPACVGYDTLVDTLVGGGVARENIDVAQFVRWAELSKTQVPDGGGSVQPLAVFNGVFDSEQTVWDAYHQICVMSRATPCQIGTQVSVMLDEPDDPVQVFNVGNILRESYSNDWLAVDERAQEVDVEYANEDDDYKTRDPLRIIPYDNISNGESIKKTNVKLVGCTNTVQAYYFGYHRLLENKLLLQTHTWESPVQAIVCRVGNVVLLQHDLPGYAEGGRVAGGTASAVRIDREDLALSGAGKLTVVHPVLARGAATIQQIAGSTVAISGYAGGSSVKRLVLGDQDKMIESYSDTGAGTATLILDDVDGLAVGNIVTLYDLEVMETRSISAVNRDTITLSSPLSAAPLEDALYIFEAGGESAIKVRIREIRRSGDNVCRITAIDYDPAVFDIPAPDDLLPASSGGGSGTPSTPDTPTDPGTDTYPAEDFGQYDPGYDGSPTPANVSRTTSTLSAPTAVTLGGDVYATVTVIAEDGTVPTGSVSLVASGTTLASADLDSAGLAALSFTPSAITKYLVRAQYSGDSARASCISNYVAIMVIDSSDTGNSPV